MKSVYGKECPKHPELAGRRYVPGNGCIKCRNESSKRNNAKIKVERKARDERLAKCLELLAHEYGASFDEIWRTEVAEVLKGTEHEIQ